MKKLIITLMMTVSTQAMAKTECSTTQSQEQVEEQMEIKTDVPKHLEGATITITLKDGRTSTVPAEKFKVVPRKQQFIVTKTSTMSKEMCTVEDSKRHRVSVLGGHGAQEGLSSNRSQAPSRVTVESNVGAVVGAQYQYRTDLKLLDKPVSVGGQLQSNETGSVMIGIDF